MAMSDDTHDDARDRSQGEPRAGSDWRGRFTAFTSFLAFLISGYTLWATSLKQSDLHIFVPAVIQYSAPYQNTNFEVIVVPVTFANEGARTAVALSMELIVTDPRSKASKIFYSADFGQWTMERTRNRAYLPFAPLPLAGRATRTETVLFYPRGDDQKPDQIIREIGSYQFRLSVEESGVGTPDWLDRLLGRIPAIVRFDRELREFDARAFQGGTLPLIAKDWRSTSSSTQ